MFGILVIALFFMGLEIDMKIIWAVLKKPIGPSIGLVCQFVFMPLCSYGLAKGLLLNGKIRRTLKIINTLFLF
jgi:sodium/bile acid cotransporter 3/5